MIRRFWNELRRREKEIEWIRLLETRKSKREKKGNKMLKRRMVRRLRTDNDAEEKGRTIKRKRFDGQSSGRKE